MLLKDILSGPMVERIGWTLIHLLWQAVALAAILAVVLVFMRKSRANIRYLAACSALVLMVLAPCVTIFMVPVSESGFEGFADTAGVPLDLAAAPMEPVEVLAPVEIEPIAAADVTTPIVPAGPSYSWKEQASMLFEPALPYLVLGWLAGVFGLSVWHLGGWAQLQRLRRRMVKQVGPPWNQAIGELAERLRVRRAVELVESALVRVPTVVGWLRPVILLPASALTGLTGEQLQAILAHELAHIKRFDYLVNMLQTAVEILGFYHPAVWWVSHKIRVERENCCDDLAVSVSGPESYARALTSMEEIRGGRPQLAVAASGGSLLERIRRLVGKESVQEGRTGWVPSAAGLLLIVTLAVSTMLALTAGKASEKMDIETILEKVRKAQRPCENTRIEWTVEMESGGSAAARAPSPPEKRISPTGRRCKGTAVIGGVRCRIEERQETYYGKEVNEPGNVREYIYVFDGTQHRQLETRETSVKGFQGRRSVAGLQLTNTTAQLLRKRLFGGLRPPIHNEERLKEYKLTLTRGEEPGRLILDAFAPKAGLYRLTVDADRGYNVIKKEWFGRNNRKGLEYNFKLKQYTNGIWFINEWEEVRFGRQEGTKPHIEEKVTITNVEFDIPPVDEALFRLQFPEGTMVADLSFNYYSHTKFLVGCLSEAKHTQEDSTVTGILNQPVVSDAREGSGEVFGPVRERLINNIQHRKDCFIDFGTGRLVSVPESFHWETKQEEWLEEKSVDARVETDDGLCGVWTFNAVVIPVSSERWDSITPGACHRVFDEAKGIYPPIMSAEGKLPATFLFQTWDNRGILQILEVKKDSEPRSIKVRYKLIQEQPAEKVDADVEGAWGEAVEGVQCRLWSDKRVWRGGQVPATFKVGVRNIGAHVLALYPNYQYNAAELEVDGQSYHIPEEFGRAHADAFLFGPGQQHSGHIPGLGDSFWRSKTDGSPLELLPGKHTIRAAFTVEAKDRAESIRFVSNPVEIEILPAEAVVDAESDTTSEAEQIDMEGLWGKGGIVEGRGRLDADSLGNVLPAGWQLDYDSGRIPEGRSWRSGMASDLAELRVVPRPVDLFDLSWKKEWYDFKISSLQGEEMGVIGVAGEIGDTHLTLRPDTYLVEYTRGRGKNPDNFKMRCGKFLVDLSRPGMYKLKFSPKLGSAEIAGGLEDCYALNFEKVGAGPQIDGLVYQHPPKQYLLDGLPPGRYRLSGVRQRQGDNVFVSHAEVTVKDGETVIADMDAAALGTCSLHGKILGKLSEPRADLRGEFQWFVLIRKPDSPPVTTADAYEALTMDTIYVVRGQNIVRETEEQARYHIEEMAPGKYTATVIEHDLSGGSLITRQQSKPLMIKANEEAVLDFDLEGTENQSGSLSMTAASATESQFVATLPNGVTVELVGVCRDPMKKGQQWWRPNGLEMAEPEYETHGKRSLPFPCYGYLLRFTPFENISVRTEAGTEAFHSRRPVTANGQCIAYAGFGQAHDVREIPDRAIVTVEVACAQWKEQGPSGDNVFPDVVNLSDGHTILLSGLRENTEPRLPGETLIEATTNLKDVEVGLDYVLEDGSRHEAGWDERKSVGWGKMIQYTFDIADRPESIKKIIVKHRLFETVQFKNVSLKPGGKTAVQVVVAAAAGRERLEKVNLKDVEVKNIIAKLGEWTGKSIIAESDVLNQKITVFSADELTRSDALSVIYAALSQRGIVAEKKGDIIILRRAEDEYLRSVAPEMGEQIRVDEKTRKQEIAARLAALEEHRQRLQRDLDTAEQALQEVRDRWRIVDLEDPSGRAFQHTITLRLNSLTLERDRCVLERRQLEATIKNLEERADRPDGKARLQQAQEELPVLASKLEQLEQMRQEVEGQQKDLDSARIQYQQRLVIRDERQGRLDAIKEQIETLKIVYDDPEVDEVSRGFYERVTAAKAERLDRRLSKQEIAAKLASLEDRRRRIEVELRIAEEAMQEVRTRFGFTDLEERSYPHPVTQRLIRLERQRDECALEIAQLQAQIRNLQDQADTPQGKANLKKAQEQLVVLREKLEALQEMSEQAEAKEHDLDAARVQHKQRAAIRDERKRMLESIKADIERWKILHDDPQTPETPSVPEGR